ncbi:DNA cytosine methyltransferase [Leptonema illini]|uniref:Cytosine-specific methyltransferase n=1 Tax=Leptonema illini DSM 21528 TaxID=929563 RepID=H2CGF9_9LEPT|nr:DNA cytosine methyltransferase [Leptonema illini]EHQ06874.1 DNA-cytosine methyltransferase [Leptonema illini DSM 21528]
MRSKPTAIDLFSGCGGMTQGLKSAGFSVLASAEILAVARETYHDNHPEVRQYTDVRRLTGATLLSDLNLRPGELDLLAGCPPCQGFSTIRTRNKPNPVADERNELIFDFLRLALALRPKAILMENVPGLMKDRRLEKTARRLRAAGYDVEVDVIDAADFGVPQRRKRMILVATRTGRASLPSGDSKQRTVADAIRDLPKAGKSGIHWHDLKRDHSEKVMNIIRRISKDGGSRSDLGKEQLECHKRTDGFRDVYGRLSWNKVSSTITRSCVNPSKGRFIHPEEDRAITVFEAALLQSFPKSYRFSRSINLTEVTSMIGEALPPLFAKKQGLHIRRKILNRQ